jgi:hypothetical protein
MHLIDITFVEGLLILGNEDLFNANKNSESQVIHMTMQCDNKPSLSHAHSEKLKCALLSRTEHFKTVVLLL